MGERADWEAHRRRMEAARRKSTPDGRPRRRHWPAFELAVRVFDLGLRLLRLHDRGVRNARNVEVRELNLELPGLPPAFDGYRIVQLSDLHLDALPGFSEHLASLLEGVSADLIVLTGDYLFSVGGSAAALHRELEDLAPALRAEDGVLAILGNHDPADFVPVLETFGARVLINESVSLERDGARLQVTGVDDVHYYYTPEASQALSETDPGLRIALVHSPELVEQARAAGFDLYLTGHTHGGQVCLPGGIPILTHSTASRRYARGRWKAGALTGYTSRGCGVSALPVRFNCRGEIPVFTLRRAAAECSASPGGGTADEKVSGTLSGRAVGPDGKGS
jgi:predicted MPP superfamily phosphohydrolase